MNRFAFAIPGDIDLPTGGYAYDRRVMADCRAAGWDVDHLVLAGDFPNPTPKSLEAAASAFVAVAADIPILVDGLAFGALPPNMLQSAGRRFIALVHHPLALETGLSAIEQDRLRESERQALAFAEAVIVTSPATARVLVADYAVEADCITVAPPGVDAATRALGGREPPMLLAVGAVVPRKGYPILVEALAQLRHLPWRCRIVGAIDRDRAEAGRTVAAILRHDLTDRIEIAGQLSAEALSRAFAGADLFVLASFHEGYGMVFSEALARGLPIVGTHVGAVPETVPANASLLVAPGDAAALAEAIARVLREPATRQSMADVAWAAGQKLPRWSDTAARIMRVIAGPQQS